MINELKNNFEKITKELSGTEKIFNYRKENFLEFEKNGFPNKTLEDWKFSDFNQLIKNNFKEIHVNYKKKKQELNFKNFINNFDHNYIIFHNGFLKNYSFKFEKEQFIEFNTFEKITDLEKIILGKNIKKNSLISFNNAFFTDGIFLNIKENYKCKKPFVIYNLFDASEKINSFNQKLIVNLSKNSQLDLVNQIINLNSSSILFNFNQEFLINENSILKKFDLDNFNGKDLIYNFLKTNINKNGIFENFIFASKAGFRKDEINSNLLGEHSSSFVNGAMYLDDNKQHEIKTNINHQEKNTKSYQKIKSIVNESAKGVFQGKIFVNSKAQKTNAYQLSKALLLDNNCEFDSKPELEIYADDVKCSHGSTSGNLDQDSIFYLMSRGLNYHQAKNLLVKAFLFDAIESITNKDVKKFFIEILDNKLHGTK